jgi:monothiol glutaredoxin
MTDDQIRSFIENTVEENRVMLFMKGTPQAPACGFSARTAGALNTIGIQYAALDILPDPRIREHLSAFSGWPTIPQLFVDGELVGGCDIVTEMFESGELAELLGAEHPEGTGHPEGTEALQDEPAKAPPIGLENRLN